LVHVLAEVQVMHAAPARPQALVLEGDRHWFPPLQQPLGHDVASQTHAPPTHRWPESQKVPRLPQLQSPLRHVSASAGLHDVQAIPGFPQSETVVGEVQTPLLQQPFGQLAALHAHWPLTHCWLSPHGLEPPHLHWPAASHVSAFVRSQGAQALPPKPHLFNTGGRRHTVRPSQQPSAHEV